MKKLPEKSRAFQTFEDRGRCAVCMETIDMLWSKQCCLVCDKNGSYKKLREEEERRLIRQKEERQLERKALRKKQRRRR